MLNNILISSIGALNRRYWGGWLSPDSAVKRILTFLLATGCAFLQYQQVIPALIMGGIILFSFLMPYHGFGISMGRHPSTHPAWLSFLVMLLQYGGTAAVACFVMYLFGLVYLPLGVFVPVAYYVAWKIWDKKQITFGHFLDSPTAYAELVLGACMYGGLYGT